MRLRGTIVGLFLATPALAAPPALPPDYPPGLYDEDRVPAYTLPDPLITLAGKPITRSADWPARRTEILRLFADHVYGHAPLGRPAEMTWLVEPLPAAATDPVHTTRVTLRFAGTADGPQMTLRLHRPAQARGRTPAFVFAGTGYAPWAPPADPDRPPEFAAAILARGYSLVTCDLGQVDPDRRDGYAQGLRAYYARRLARPASDHDWGTLSSWAWSLSRALDYLETDAAIDPARIAVVGFSRYGKVAMWAGAQDPRFALVCSGLSGCAGATLVRRGYGETVASVTGYAPHWFAPGFASYAQRVPALPVDWHLLIAAIAPRPLYLATAEQDYWNDPHGQFLAAVAADPVYHLLGRPGLGTTQAPAIGTPVGDTVRYHCRPGNHALTAYDWAQFLAFADRHFGRSTPSPTPSP